MPRRATDNIPTLLPAKPDSYLRLKNCVISIIQSLNQGKSEKVTPSPTKKTKFCSAHRWPIAER